MCIKNTLQQYILDITDDGKSVADFLRATMQGNTPNAKTHHRLEAAKQLTKLALIDHPAAHPEPAKEHAEDEQPTENCELITDNSQLITESDIINHNIARLIREETNDGYHIADFLARVMRGEDARGAAVSPADRMAAAKELLNRGLGKFGDARNRRIPNTPEDQELIHSGIARYIRECADDGIDAARFLLDVASGRDADFSMHQRLVATRELLRRAWDTNYDAVTPEHIAAYHERQDKREPTEYDIRLRQWREEESAAQEAQHKADEDEPQLEDGIFAHLTFAEIARYEAMTPKDQAKFVARQRARRENDQPEAIQPKPTDESTDEPTDEPAQDTENINWNAVLQNIGASPRHPNPTRLAAPDQTHIRSP